MRFRRNSRARAHVLMLVQNNPYPQDPRVWAEATTLHENGYRVTVIAPRAEGQPAKEVVDGVSVRRFGQHEGHGSALGDVFEHVYGTLAIAAAALRIASSERVDAVHAHNPPDTLLPAVALLKLLGKKFVFDHHDLAPELFCARFDHPPRGLVYRSLVLLERLSCRLADHVLTANESHRELEVRRAGISAEKVTVVRNGPTADWFEATVDAGRNGSPTIAFAGVMGPQDGADLLVRAFSQLRHTNSKLLMVGDGDGRSEAETLATSLGVADRVRFVGRVPRDEMIELLSGVDVCVEPAPRSPYNEHSTMLKVMEYMALAKPVVAFDLRENRASGGDALVYAANGEAALAAEIDSLLDDPARRVMLGELGRARVETRLAWRHSAPALLRAYSTLLERPSDVLDQVV